MHRILIFFSLIILSSQAVPDSRVTPDGFGGYYIKDQPNSRHDSSAALNRIINSPRSFGPSITERQNQQNLQNNYKLQQILQLKNQNDLMKQQIESQRQLQQMQKENETLRRKLESNPSDHNSDPDREKQREQACIGIGRMAYKVAEVREKGSWDKVRSGILGSMNESEKSSGRDVPQAARDKILTIIRTAYYSEVTPTLAEERARQDCYLASNR